jgi:hypothetical protein
VLLHIVKPRPQFRRRHISQRRALFSRRWWQQQLWRRLCSSHSFGFSRTPLLLLQKLPEFFDTCLRLLGLPLQGVYTSSYLTTRYIR